jgi:hypothetical protein
MKKIKYGVKSKQNQYKHVHIWNAAYEIIKNSFLSNYLYLPYCEGGGGSF